MYEVLDVFEREAVETQTSQGLLQLVCKQALTTAVHQVAMGNGTASKTNGRTT
jgi:hypothetical protein